MEDEPKILYKYRSLSDANMEFTRDIFMNHQLYFPHPDQINDPFDCKLLPDLEGLTKEVLIEQVENYNPEMLESDSTNLDEIKKNIINTPLPQLIDALRQNINSHQDVGVLSFSENYEDILMWGHYADSHKGICIGFDRSELSFSFREMPTIPERVKYPENNEYPKWNPFVDDVNTQIVKVYFTKAKDWKYEQEWRVIIPEQGRTPQKISPNALISVHLGCQIEEDHKKKVIDWCSQKDNKPKVYEMKKDDTSYSLKENEISY